MIRKSHSCSEPGKNTPGRKAKKRQWPEAGLSWAYWRNRKVSATELSERWRGNKLRSRSLPELRSDRAFRDHSN